MSDDVDILPYQGDAYVKVSNVTDAKTGLAITDATVTVTLLTKGDGAISGATNLPATYDSPTAAYWAIVPRSAGVALGQKYRAKILVDKAGFQVPFYQEVVVERFPA